MTTHDDTTQRSRSTPTPAGDANEHYVLRLYVTGMTPRSTQAFATIKAICEEHLHGPLRPGGDRHLPASAAGRRRADHRRADAGEEAARAAAPDDRRPVRHRARAGRPRPARASVEAPWPTRRSAPRSRSCAAGWRRPRRRSRPSARARSTASSSARRTARGTRIYTLEGAERPYRILVEQMQQGAATLTADGTDRLLQPLPRRARSDIPHERIVGPRAARPRRGRRSPVCDALLREAAQWRVAGRGLASRSGGRARFRRC